MSEYNRRKEDKNVLRALEGLEGAIREINDSNVLHRHSLEKNTEAMKQFMQNTLRITWFLVIAVCILALGKELSPFLIKAIPLVG